MDGGNGDGDSLESLSVDPFVLVQEFTAEMTNARHLANQPINSIQPDGHKKRRLD